MPESPRGNQDDLRGVRNRDHGPLQTDEGPARHVPLMFSEAKNALAARSPWMRSAIGIGACAPPHRQATFSTNNSPKNKPFTGVKVVKKFRQWERKDLATLTHQYDTYRCRQEIADLADSLFPDEPRTNLHRNDSTGHDGIFLARHSEVDSYVRDYQPQVLRLDIRTDCHNLSAMNFLESKGLSFDRVIVFPHRLGSAG